MDWDTPDWFADSEADAKKVLEGWGRLAPPRLERRGRNKVLEAFVLRRMLLALISAREIRFPLEVRCAENPDFFVTEAGHSRGIEVTDAVDPDEQAKWTARDKRAAEQEEPIFIDIDLDDPMRPVQVRNLVSRAIKTKASKISEEVSELLLHLNTNLDSFEDWEWRRIAIGEAPVEAQAFRRIWLWCPNGLAEIYPVFRVVSID